MLYRAGANLLEEHPVKDATFDKSKGMWTVNIENGISFMVIIMVLICLCNDIVSTWDWGHVLMCRYNVSMILIRDVSWCVQMVLRLAWPSNLAWSVDLPKPLVLELILKVDLTDSKLMVSFSITNLFCLVCKCGYVTRGRHYGRLLVILNNILFGVLLLSRICCFVSSC